jgi:hypothetical protein
MSCAFSIRARVSCGSRCSAWAHRRTLGKEPKVRTGRLPALPCRHCTEGTTGTHGTSLGSSYPTPLRTCDSAQALKAAMRTLRVPGKWDQLSGSACHPVRRDHHPPRPWADRGRSLCYDPYWPASSAGAHRANPFGWPHAIVPASIRSTLSVPQLKEDCCSMSASLPFWYPPERPGDALSHAGTMLDHARQGVKKRTSG